ncbi:hypothetical protein K3N28_17560 [Glycomyces sp. TRM65418]|uniref:hypothetical protein n=1 Tax=Glycomyces sp. TRM65418 TaxID=2867006 RepID=UPI001CE5E68A|nr:hypothetical protein [Glycomyces sp. TRM65418]MCC3764868.1 hypothetical protein [Glycomyces sp. TRM65418]QZD54513.1 hypothetical protein K3N28_17475 [Glycomyces sp. TRM65418]
MHIRSIIEGVTGRVRSAAAVISQRSSRLFAGPHEHHRVRRFAVIGVAAAVFTGTGATAAWAISNADDPAPEPTAEAAPQTDEPAATSEAATEAPTEAATSEAPAEAAPAPAKEPAGPVDIDVADLDDEQEANAVTIIETGKELGFDENGWAVALATAMQEAKLYNAASEAVPESFEYTDSEVSYSDHDSVGLFQQRTSMGWGSVEELMDPATSASKFYNTLADVDGWEGMSIAAAAQAVQISAYPDYYAQWEGLAWDIIAAYEAAS